MSKKEIILFGGGGHCESCIEVIESSTDFSIAGIVDNQHLVGSEVLGYPIIACDDDIPQLARSFRFFHIAIGHVLTAEPRIRIYRKLKENGITLPIIISHLALISKRSTIGEGTIVFPYSILDVGVRVGVNCIINHANTLGHYAQVEDHCHVSANCVLGKCVVGEGTFIGGNSWVTNNVTIAPQVVIGSGSNVIKSIEAMGIYAGNPARKL
jgi:sugar O-acyltransferase (sialic acid O-acetyltransferase NeuD family)